MQNKQVFIDTNLLVYAHDTDAGDRHSVAKGLVTDLWNRPLAPAISVQVLQELYVNLIRKGIADDAARQTVEDYRVWAVVNNDSQLLMDGIGLRERWQCSFWDALILAAAKRAQASVIWSEDFNTGQIYDGIVVVNPLQ